MQTSKAHARLMRTSGAKSSAHLLCCKVAESAEQTWRENCKISQRDAQNVRKEKEELDGGMKELAERAREFEHRAHRNKVAYDKYKGKYEALKEENARLQKIQHTIEIPEEQSLLF